MYCHILRVRAIPTLESTDSMIIDVGVVINDISSLSSQGEGGGAFIKELHDSHVGCACNDCNGSTICIYHEQKTSACMLMF